jgi:hypothetical protein
MMRRKRVLAFCAAFLLSAAAWIPPLAAQDASLDELLKRSGGGVVQFLEQLGSVTCSEQVLQEKFDPKGKVAERLQSSFEYLVLQQNEGSEPVLYESRQATKEAHSKKNISLLVSNGFATELLVFHPYYQPSFTFERLADVQVNGKTYAQIRFLHVKGRPTPAALQLRGRDYPLSLTGTALIEPASGVVERISTDLGISMEDLGLKRFHSDVEYAPVGFARQTKTYWLPAQATVEVDTPKQHWKNVHHFSGYHLFSVSTSEEVDVSKAKAKDQ